MQKWPLRCVTVSLLPSLPSRVCGLTLWAARRLLPSGEIHELKEELANPKMEKKKEAVKKGAHIDRALSRAFTQQRSAPQEKMPSLT